MPPLIRWPAPEATAPVTATVAVPGSKSETNRALILAALASGPSMITNGLEARDTQLMRDGLRALGVQIDESDDHWSITPPEQFLAGGTIDCGLAGTVMRFLPAVAALAGRPVSFDGDEQAYARPMAVILDALTHLGGSVDHDRLPFTISGADLRGGVVTIDSSSSSQFVSGLLLAGARFPAGLDLRHVGSPIPSMPNIAMTVARLRERGVVVDDSEPDRWVVTPGPISPLNVTIEPDLANAAPFLAAAAVTGGTIRVPHWPTVTNQPGDAIRAVLQQFGARVGLDAGILSVQGTNHLHGVDLDLHDASELTPVVAALAALADHTSHIRGVAHIRGHETDRLAALETELNRLGVHATQTPDGLTIHPRLVGGALWHTYADHRMAHAGAVLGLVVPEVELDDISCTTKTMPEFADLWDRMLADSGRTSDPGAVQA